VFNYTRPLGEDFFSGFDSHLFNRQALITVLFRKPGLFHHELVPESARLFGAADCMSVRGVDGKRRTRKPHMLLSS
jgi:hypothetical protein